MVVVVVAIPLLSSSVACCPPVGVYYEDAFELRAGCTLLSTYIQTNIHLQIVKT